MVEEEVSEMDDDRTYATKDGSNAQDPTSMNANHTPASPSAPPSSAGINTGASATHRGLFPQAMGVQPHHYSAQMWYNGSVWANDSHNTPTSDTRHIVTRQ